MDTYLCSCAPCWNFTKEAVGFSRMTLCAIWPPQQYICGKNFSEVGSFRKNSDHDIPQIQQLLTFLWDSLREREYRNSRRKQNSGEWILKILSAASWLELLRVAVETWSRGLMHLFRWHEYTSRAFLWRLSYGLFIKMWNAIFSISVRFWFGRCVHFAFYFMVIVDLPL
jgi:hypothetical protein